MADRSTLAVITGTSRGIGAGIAAAAASTAVVAPCNRTATGVDDELVTDLGTAAGWDSFAAWLPALVDAVDPDRLVVVHNAATLTPIGFAGEVDSSAYRSNVVLNSAAPQILGDIVVATATDRQLATTIVQLSSGAGKTPYPGWSSYCAAKAAVDMWVRVVGAEQAERNDLVRALALGPGVVDTGMQQEIRSSEAADFPQVDRFRGMHSGGTLGDPADVGRQIWEIAQNGAWANGSVLDVRNL